METKDEATRPGYSKVQNIGMGVALSTAGAFPFGEKLLIDNASTQPLSVVLSTCQGHMRYEDYLTYKLQSSIESWKSERRASPSSSIERLFASVHYIRLIEAGLSAVPLLLAEMEARPDHWDRALEEITGENPAPPELDGKLREIAMAWVDWGRSRCLI